MKTKPITAKIRDRNHQKIAVIDGDIGYTGGTNLADEYANYYPKHGHSRMTYRSKNAPSTASTSMRTRMYCARWRH